MGGTGQEEYNNIPNEVDGAHSIQQTTDGGFILAGYSKYNDGDVSGNHGNFNYWVVKLGNCLLPQPIFVVLSVFLHDDALYPIIDY